MLLWTYYFFIAVIIWVVKMLQIKLGSNEIRVDVKCIKGGKRAFERYCMRKKIKLE